MTSQRPAWLPEDCVYYEPAKLKPELTDATTPGVLLVGVDRGARETLFVAGGGEPDSFMDVSTGRPGPRWAGSLKEDEERLFKLLKSQGMTKFHRMYDGTGIDLLSSFTGRRHVLVPTPQDLSIDAYFTRIDSFFVRPEYLIK
jgi:hypothetical protein